MPSRRGFLAATAAGVATLVGLIRRVPTAGKPPPKKTTTTAAATTTTLPATTTTGIMPTTTSTTIGTGFVYDVLVLASDSNATAQSKINAAASSAIIGFEAGTHAERRVTPKLGQTLRGNPNGLTVFDGSRLVTGWTGTGPWVANHTITDRGEFIDSTGVRTTVGNIGAQYPEELFFETPGSNSGWTRKRRDGTPSTSTPPAGAWTISYSAGTLRVAENPTSVNVRVSVTDRAIVSPGTGTGGLTIEHITFQKYATATRWCPWGDGDNPDHRDWTIRRVASYDNHGSGAVIMPGDTLRNCRLGWNGQIGFIGYCDTPTVNGWELLDSEVLYNMRAPFDHGWEGGGSKFQATPDNSVAKPVLVRNCWVHHNQGPQVWADENLTITGNSTIESNLIEDGEIQGIFWEITSGTALVRWNRLLRNGGGVANLAGPTVGDEDAAVDISNSRGVTVTQNVIDTNKTGILARDDDRDPFLGDANVNDNSVKAALGTGDGHTVKYRPGSGGATRIATCGADSNRYWTPQRFSYNNNFGQTFAQWQAARGGGGLTGALDPNGTGGLTGSVTNPSTFVAFTTSHYGPGT
jgi:hypothetical protein